MHRGRSARWAGVFLAMALPAGKASGQGMPPKGAPLAPRIVSVFPAGAKAGSTVEVTVAGTDLEGPIELIAGARGVKAEAIESPKPPEKEKDKAPAMRGRNGAVVPLQRRAFRVEIPADLPPGILDLRLANEVGLSNPRTFAVDDLEGVREVEPNDDVPGATRPPRGFDRRPDRDPHGCG